MLLLAVPFLPIRLAASEFGYEAKKIFSIKGKRDCFWRSVALLYTPPIDASRYWGHAFPSGAMGQVLVAVIERRVRLEATEPEAAARPAVIKAADTATVEGAATKIESTSTDSVVYQLSWRNGMLTFKQTKLADAAAEFNRYNSKQLHISETAADTCIGGSFEATNVDAFVRLLAEGFGLKATESGGGIDIFR